VIALSDYAGIAPKGDLLLIHKLAEKLQGRKFLHINSTKSGGGVAEILQQMIPLLVDIGINAVWDVIEGDSDFFNMTKKVHNSMQGMRDPITEAAWEHHYEINMANADKLDLDADCVLIHDPQPVALIERRTDNCWMWRCHIDISRPQPDTWNKLRPYVEKYDMAVFSVSKFAQSIQPDKFLIPPSIDPLSEKNRNLEQEEIDEVLENYKIPKDKPILLQISRFDRFKDPIGVIQAYRLVKKYNDCRLILAGGAATDDPEGEMVLQEVMEYAANDPDIHILLLPPFSDKAVNALQRAADIIFQKSLKEGFGLTVTEAMWKEKPVIGGNVGGIPIQIVHGATGFLVNSVEGAAFRTKQFLNNPAMIKRMGERGREHVRMNFLITRQIRDYLSAWFFLENGRRNTIEL